MSLCTARLSPPVQEPQAEADGYARSTIDERSDEPPEIHLDVPVTVTSHTFLL